VKRTELNEVKEILEFYGNDKNFQFQTAVNILTTCKTNNGAEEK
jgi:hypothetical protein